MPDCVYAFIWNRHELMDNTHEMNNLWQRAKTVARVYRKVELERSEWGTANSIVEAKTIPWTIDEFYHAFILFIRICLATISRFRYDTLLAKSFNKWNFTLLLYSLHVDDEQLSQTTTNTIKRGPRTSASYTTFNGILPMKVNEKRQQQKNSEKNRPTKRKITKFQ